MSCEEKSCEFVRNKSTIKMFLTSKPLLPAKILDSIHNIAFSSPLIWIRREICTDRVLIISQISPKQRYVDVFWCERTTGNGLFFVEEVLLWILDSCVDLKLKSLDGFVSNKHSFSLHKTLTDGLESWWLLVYYCDVLIRFWDSHSDGTHSWSIGEQVM